MRINNNNDKIYYLGILITGLSMLNLYHESPFISIIFLGTGIGMILTGYYG